MNKGPIDSFPMFFKYLLNFAFNRAQRAKAGIFAGGVARHLDISNCPPFPKTI